jgi:glycosidase
MIRSLAIILCSLCLSPAFAQQEVMYHITVRSFFDSDGDGHGDLKGIQQKLDYLQQLGITTISLSPIYQSDFYYNLYAGDLEKIDPKYGAFKEYRDLIQNLHKRKMKLYQEVDLQYINTKHLWFTDSFKNTKSAYSGYIYYTDLKNEQPFYLPEVTTYTNTKEKLVAVNLKNAKVAAYYSKALGYWADPNKDGNFDDGVDGFRIVDIQDKFDTSGRTNGQLKDFYAPLFANLKKVNPKLMVLAEAANTKDFGTDLYTRANADRVASAKMRESILSFDKTKILQAADSTFLKLPADKYPVIYIEDENTTRTASLPKMNAGKLRAAAGLSFLMGGEPSVYYGQEIGMMGQATETGNEGDKIPLTEAYDWYTAAQGQGMALWYKDTGAWWNNTTVKANDGISAEEQQKDANSLFSFYRQLIKVKKMQPSLALGIYKPVVVDNDKVICFMRIYDNKETGLYERALVMINLSGENQPVSLAGASEVRTDRLQLIIGTPNASFKKESKDVVLTPYAVQVWRFIP